VQVGQCTEHLARVALDEVVAEGARPRQQCLKGASSHTVGEDHKRGAAEIALQAAVATGEVRVAQPPKAVRLTDQAGKAKAKQARNQYFLLMEMLGPPYWVYPNPAAGLSHEQAKAAVVALARMHNAFDKKEVMDKLQWLPLTIFNIGEGDAGITQRETMQEEFANKVSLERHFVQQTLPAGAYEAVERMTIGGLIEICEKLAEPPLTFCHGDFRTENIRFQNVDADPEVATFDFGLSCKAIPAYDLAYFIMLSQPPHARRTREGELIYLYLIARGVDPSEQNMGKLFGEVKIGALGVLALTLTTRLAARNAGFYAETRETQRRMLRWVGQAVEDWSAFDVLQEKQSAEIPPAIAANPAEAAGEGAGGD